jgi:hypothetical protein
MATKSFVRTRAGQRVDQPDFERASDTSTRDVVEQLGEHILTGSDTNRHYVLEGFTTTAVGTVVTVLGGVGLFGYRDRGELRYGSVMSSGATSRSIDVSSFTDGAYTVYVALTLNDAEFGNRAFWDAALGTPAEVTRNVPTRRAENWAIAVETASPGAEWLPIATFTKTGASLSAPADIRELFFEGRANNSPAYSVTDAEWGSANDRNANRSTYGIRSLRKFVRAVQRQLSSIIGGTGWWSTIPAGADLTTLLSSKLARDGSQTMQGNLTPDGDNTRNLGAAGTRWANIFSALGYFNTVTAYTRLLVSNSNLATLGGGRARILDGVTVGTSPNLEHRTIYQNENSALTSSPTLEIAINAEWYYDLGLSANRWQSYNTGAESFLYSFSRSGFFIHRRIPTASPWTDGSWALLYSFDENIASLPGPVAAGATTVASLTTAGAVNSGSLTTGAIVGTTVTGTSATFSGLMTSSTALVNGTATADQLALDTVAPATPATNTAYANTLVVARGTITTDGLGGVAISTTTPTNTVNVASATVQGNGVRVTFTTSPPAGRSYQALVSCRSLGVVGYVSAVNIAYFDFGAFTSSSGSVIDLHLGVSSSRTFDFIVVGG